MNYRINPPDTYDPRGPDGQGRNRLRVEVVTPAPRCRLRPETYEAAWTHDNRPTHAAACWSSFGPCVYSGDCAGCPLAVKRAASWLFWPDPPDRSVIRALGDDLHLMNRQRGGFRQRSIPYRSWAALYADVAIRVVGKKTDEHGEYIEIADPESP